MWSNPVILTDSDGNKKEYPSMTEAAKAINVGVSSISCACMKNKRCKGYLIEKNEECFSKLTKTQAEVVLGYAEASMSIADASKMIYMTKNNVAYNLTRIYEKTGLNPRNFYNLCDLVVMAKERMEETL